MTVAFSITPSPIGDLLLTLEGGALTRLLMSPFGVSPEWTRDEAALAPVRTMLAQYFAGDLRNFDDIAIAPAGTEFQRQVWQALCEIPYGETWSYGKLAAHIGNPTASRAVGLANGRNPIAVIVPCHRVIGADGSLTGYAGGTERKRLLLDLEAAGTGATPLRFDTT